MVLTDSHRISRVPRYSGYCYHLLQLTYTGLSPPMAVLSNTFYFVEQQISQSYNPSTAETVLVWAIPISLAATLGITIVFSSSGYLDVSVLRVCLRLCRIIPLHGIGLPHSEIFGSKVMCTSPKLIAACHVLHRL